MASVLKTAVERRRGESRQLHWKRARLAAGLCGHCGMRPLFTRCHCRACAVKNRERVRQLRGSIRRYRSFTYHGRKGTP